MEKHFGDIIRIGLGTLGALFVLTLGSAANAAEDDEKADDATTKDSEDDLLEEDSEDVSDVVEADSADEKSKKKKKKKKHSKATKEGGRFRFGIAGGGGPLSTDGVDLTYYGMDLRFGWQINDDFAVYAQPQLGYYKINGASALFGSGGLLGTSVVADYTLFDRFFVGAGLGYAILNNPSGSELHLRAGGYPLMSKNDKNGRRKGLMLGIDFRMHFVDNYTFVAPTFNIGYDAF